MSQSPSAHGPLDHAAARRLIDAFLVDDLLERDASRLAAHVERCPACAAEIGGTTRLLALLGSLPTPPPAPDLDERIYAAVVADRAHRHDHRSWLGDLRKQVFRGAVRTTGTLMVAIVTVAFLGGAFVLAAAYFTQPPHMPAPRVTVGPSMTPTPAPTTVQPTAPVETPPAVVATPAPTTKQAPTHAPTPAPSATPAVTAEPSATPAPSPSATAEPSPTPTPSPAPSPTEKPRRTPPPSASPSPTPTPTPTVAPSTTSP